MKIRIIASKPKDGQQPIDKLIGRMFHTVQVDKKCGEVSIQCEEFGGEVVLAAGEWEQVKKNFRGAQAESIGTQTQAEQTKEGMSDKTTKRKPRGVVKTPKVPKEPKQKKEKKPKAEKVVVSYKGRPEYIEGLIQDGKSDAEIKELVKETYPGSSKGMVETIIEKKHAKAEKAKNKSETVAA